MSRQKWLLIRDYIIAWMVAMSMYSLIRSVGTIETDGIQLSTGQSLLMTPIFGVILGAVFGFAQLKFEQLYNKRTPLLKLFLLRLLLSVLVLLIASILAYLIFTLMLGYGELQFWAFAANAPIFIFYLYLVLVDVVISIFRQVSLMLGTGTLKKLIKGQFYHPREEERIFMFIDLKSSTTLAEQLGHFKYSRMIQDCFDDLAVVTEVKAEIYQYVGDEAVLTWPSKEGLKNQNCIKAYFQFIQQIESRRAHYEQNYGCIPFFKAGLNIGKVTVAEVGKTKKEIAYHGDAINTAARIQGMCNEFDSEVLMSSHLKDALGADNGFIAEQVGDIALKGKAQAVSIFRVVNTL